MFLLAAVPPPLRTTVRRVAAYDEHTAAPIRRRQAPVPTATLVLGLGDPLAVDGRAIGSFVAGVGDRPALTEFRGHQAGVQVDLTPLGAARLLGLPLGGLGVARPLDDLRGESAAGTVLAGLPARLGELATWPARLDAVLVTLTRLLADAGPGADPEVVGAWRRLVEQGGRVPLDDLAREAGWSRRHLTRRFHAQMGLPPTTFARVVRFRRAADLLVPPPGRAASAVVRVADVAARCGFADHAHLDREFRGLAGCTPRDYVAEWAAVRVDPGP